MRLNRVRLGAAGALVAAHPRITLIWAADPDERSSAAAWISGAPWRRGAGGETLELNGVLLDGTIDLPGLDLPERLKAVLTANEVAVRSAASPELNAASRKLKTSLEAVEELHRAIERDRQERATLAEERKKIAAALEMARNTLDLEAVEEVRRLEVAVEAEQASIQRAPEPVFEDEEPELEEVPDESTVLNEEREELLERLAAYEAQLEAEAGIGLAEAGDRLEAARAQLAEAESRIIKPDTDPATRERLEAVHEEMCDQRDRTANRIGGNKARKRLEVLEAEQHELLARLGFPSWTAYVMGDSFNNDDEDVKRHEEAQAAYEEEAELWQTLVEMMESNVDWLNTLDRLDTVEAELARLDADAAAAAEAEAAEAADAGPAVPDDVVYGPSAMTIEEELDDARARLRQHEAVMAKILDVQRRYDALGAAELELEESIEARIGLVTLAENGARTAADRLLTLLPSATPAAGTDLAPTVLQAELARRSIGGAGSVPVVLDDCSTSLDPDDLTEVRNLLVDASFDVQIILLTGCEETLKWARSLGPEVVNIVSLTGELAA